MGCNNSSCVKGGEEEGTDFEEGKRSSELTDEEVKERMEIVSMARVV